MDTRNEKLNSSSSEGSDEKKIRKIVKEEMMKNYKSGTPFIPPHKHNGNDNLRIRQVDLITNTKFTSEQIYSSNETNVFKVISNPSTVLIAGNAINSSERSAATVTGNAQLGTCVRGLDLDSETIIQSCSSQTITLTAGSLVSSIQQITTDQNLISIRNGGGSIVVTATVVAFGPTFVEVDVVVASGWVLTANYTII